MVLSLAMLEGKVSDANAAEKVHLADSLDEMKLAQKTADVGCEGGENLGMTGQRQKTDVVLRIGAQFGVADERDGFLLSLKTIWDKVSISHKLTVVDAKVVEVK